MNSSDYNIFLESIKSAQNISDRNKRKETLNAIKTRLVTDYGLTDEDAKYLVKKCN